SRSACRRDCATCAPERRGPARPTCRWRERPPWPPPARGEPGRHRAAVAVPALRSLMSSPRIHPQFYTARTTPTACRTGRVGNATPPHLGIPQLVQKLSTGPVDNLSTTGRETGPEQTPCCPPVRGRYGHEPVTGPTSAQEKASTGDNGPVVHNCSQDTPAHSQQSIHRPVDNYDDSVYIFDFAWSSGEPETPSGAAGTMWEVRADAEPLVSTRIPTASSSAGTSSGTAAVINTCSAPAATAASAARLRRSSSANTSSSSSTGSAEVARNSANDARRSARANDQDSPWLANPLAGASPSISSSSSRCGPTRQTPRSSSLRLAAASSRSTIAVSSASSVSAGDRAGSRNSTGR